MRVTRRRLVLVAALIGLAVATASARKLDDWPYDKLLKQADVVVIARPTGEKESKDRTDDNIWKQEMVGVETTFRVKSVLKGKPAGDDIIVLHFKLKDPEVKIVDGPCLVSFRQKKGLTVQLEGGGEAALGSPDYLLYLTAQKDGRYEPLSGRVDPALSVREMYYPLPVEAEKEKEKK